MEFSEKVLVLQVGKFREADLWVRFLSPTRGLLSAFAFGGSRSRRRFSGCLDIYNQVLFRVQATRQGSYLTLQEGVLVQGPNRLRRDWARLGIAGNCIKFMQAFDVGPEGAGAAYTLLEETLQLLEEADTLPTLLPLFFRARLSCEQGYAVLLQGCSQCFITLEEQGGFFAVRDGIVLCAECAAQHTGQMVRLGNEALSVLASIIHLPPKTWEGITLTPTAKSECARAIDGFIEYHVGLSWENGRFCRT